MKCKHNAVPSLADQQPVGVDVTKLGILWNIVIYSSNLFGLSHPSFKGESAF